MKLHSLSSVVLVPALAIVMAPANADIIASDDFTYADGSLVPNGGWATHSGTPLDLLVAGGEAVVQHGAPSEDANIAFVDQTTGVITATFDITVNDDTVIGDSGAGTDFEYFAHFFTDGSFNFRSRLSVAAPSGTGDYTLGISSTSSTEEALLPVDFNFGDTVSVALLFDVDSGIGSLTVGTDTIVGTSAATGEIINRFALRQSDSTNNETITVDNLVIDGIVPEPASLLLVGAGGLLVAGRRRRA